MSEPNHLKNWRFLVNTSPITGRSWNWGLVSKIICSLKKLIKIPSTDDERRVLNSEVKQLLKAWNALKDEKEKETFIAQKRAEVKKIQKVTFVFSLYDRRASHQILTQPCSMHQSAENGPSKPKPIELTRSLQSGGSGITSNCVVRILPNSSLTPLFQHLY